jgi:hypothetical protein
LTVCWAAGLDEDWGAGFAVAGSSGAAGETDAGGKDVSGAGGAVGASMGGGLVDVGGLASGKMSIVCASLAPASSASSPP